MAGTNGKRPPPAKPAWQRLTKRQKEAFLEHVRDGGNRPTAAAKVKATARAFRSLCTHDPLFEAAYEAARSYHDQDVQDQARQKIDEAVTSGDPKRDRLLIWYAEHKLAEFPRARQLELTGRGGGPLEYRHFDPAKLSDEQLDELDALLAQAATEE